VGETFCCTGILRCLKLSVSSNGSTWVKPPGCGDRDGRGANLSVSSNGSTWVKLVVMAVNRP